MTSETPSSNPDDVVPPPVSTAGLIGRGATLLFFVWFTGMCFYATLLWLGDQSEFDELAVEAPGQVVDMHYRAMSSNGGTVTSDPEVVFQTAAGETIRFIDTSAIDLDVVIGDAVVVRYVPDQPDWARIDSAAQDANSLAATIVLIVLTLVSAVGAFFSGRGLRRAWSRRHQAAPESPNEAQVVR